MTCEVVWYILMLSTLSDIVQYCKILLGVVRCFQFLCYLQEQLYELLLFIVRYWTIGSILYCWILSTPGASLCFYCFINCEIFAVIVAKVQSIQSLTLARSWLLFSSVTPRKLTTERTINKSYPQDWFFSYLWNLGLSYPQTSNIWICLRKLHCGY